MNNNNAINFDDESEGPNISKILFKYLRYWYLFVLAFLISGAIAYWKVKTTPSVYKASAVLLIKDDTRTYDVNNKLRELEMGGSKIVENEMQALKSRGLADKVVDDLNLTVTYWEEGKFRDAELYDQSPIKIIPTVLNGFAYGNEMYVKIDNTNKYELLTKDKKHFGTFEYTQAIKSNYGNFRVLKNDKITTLSPRIIKVLFQPKDAVISDLASNLQVGLVSDFGTLISLGLDCPLPKKGKDILSKLLEEYAFSTLEDKNREASSTLRFIEDRLKLVTTELGTVEHDVEDYKTSNGVTDLSSEANLFLGKVKDNDTKLNEVDVQQKVLEEIERSLSGTNNMKGNLAPALLMVKDQVLVDYVGKLSQLEADRSKLVQSVQPENPYLVALNGQMSSIKQAIKENIGNQRRGLQIEKNAIVGVNNRLEGAMSKIPRKEREYVEIKRQAGIKENLYLMLLKKREETALSYASTVTDSRVIDPPYASDSPISPNKNKIYLLYLLLGLAIPAILITIKELLVNTVQSKKEIESVTGLKIFGDIGLQPKQVDGEVLDMNNRSFVNEQIRMIRSNLQYLFSNKEKDTAHTILITSSVAGEGKSFITINIAASLAMLNKKVIIVGLDLRKPKISESLKVNNTKGVSNYLINKATEAEIIQQTAIENLYFISSGPVPPNPSELISNGKVQELLDVLKQSFDYILIDTPPIGLVTDASILAPYVDVTFYLIRHQFTPKLYLSNIANLNQNGRFKSLNIIFNGVNEKNSVDYGYGYGYGQSNYYAEKNKSSQTIFEKIKSL